MNSSTGGDVNIRKTQITRDVQKGGSLFSTVLSLGTNFLPVITKKVMPGLYFYVIKRGRHKSFNTSCNSCSASAILRYAKYLLLPLLSI